MQYYTKQQLQGSVRYQAHCLVGNWKEDIEMKETALKEFLAKKEQGTLKLDKYQARMNQALAPAELSKVRDEPYVHFGDLLQVVHADTGAVLSCDVEDQICPMSAAATASAEIRQPCARNTWVLVKYVPARPSAYDELYDDDKLRYGQKVCLVANPESAGMPLDSAGGAAPMCLFSKPMSTTSYAKHSRHQQVGITRRLGYDTVWTVQTPNPADRVASQGCEVMAGAPMCLMHCATRQNLCLEDCKYPNDFGTEMEVSAFSALSQKKQSILEANVKGELKGSISKAETSPNYWVFYSGSKVAELPPAEVPAFAAARVLEVLRTDSIKTTSGIEGLRRGLFRLDNDGSGSVPCDEVLLVCKQMGLTTTHECMQLLAKAYPGSSRTAIDVRALMAAVDASEAASYDA